MNRLLAIGLMIIFIGGVVFGFGLRGLADIQEPPIPLQVVNKYETNDGRCYVETWIEVSVDEYIGLDIGDEFSIDE